MEKQELKTFLFDLGKDITKFEFKKKMQQKLNKSLGTIYTPQNIADFMVLEILKLYFKTRFNINEINDLDDFFLSSSNHEKFKKNLRDVISNIKILDPACGSGRFLISMAEKLFLIHKNLDVNLIDYDIKKAIIRKNLYGTDIDKSAINISKLRLLKWALSDLSESDTLKLKIHNIDQISNKIELSNNFYIKDFLLEFNLNNFDIIIGNPPYIENKKIYDSFYKEKLKKRFNTAYKLFDLSILFIEKSLELLKKNEGLLSFLTINKFLSADYGIKLRKYLINNVEVKEIVDLSSLPVFNRIAAYPIIISLKNTIPKNPSIILKKILDLDISQKSKTIFLNKIQQKGIKIFPSYVIPIAKNLNLVKLLYNKYKQMDEVINDLKIIYRPYGFIKWSKNFKYVSQNKSSDRDLLLIGTGNVGNFHINFKKPIRIAKRKLNISYFNYDKNFEILWKELNSEKLIFREIAKNLTFTYDHGIFTNITGLYFMRIPSFDTDKLLSLLLILNSDLINFVFKTLFNTLHMAGNYLRINGSFIKRLPLPEVFPISLSRLGRVLQFLFQLKSDFMDLNRIEKLKRIEITSLENLITFYKNLSNSLVNIIYLKNIDSSIYENVFNSLNIIPKIQLKYFIPCYNILKYDTYQTSEIESIFNSIFNTYIKLSKDTEILQKITKFNRLILN